MGQEFRSDWIIVAYYTDDYKDEAKELINSLKSFGVEYVVENVKCNGSWIRNVNYKPTFIREKIEEWNRPVVYIDVDARVKKYPTLFDDIDCDFAYWLCKNGDYRISASGTLYFRPEALWFIKQWEMMCNQTEMPDQETLWKLIQKAEIKTKLLPIEYCQIFDWKEQSKDPVIVHMQASRRLKGVVGN